MIFLRCFILFLALLSYSVTSTELVHGVTEKEIVIGVSNVTTGPAANLGKELSKGARVYFNNINKQQGIYGRKIRMITYDDGYEPERTYQNTQQLVYQDKVFALFNYVGTPTSYAIMPILQKEQVLFFSPFTGADFLRNSSNKTIFNVRGSYYEEAALQVNYFVNERKYSKVGLFIQADDFGLAVTRGLNKALQTYNVKPIITTRFRRNTHDVKQAMKKLLAQKPQVIFCVGTYQPIAELINQMRAQGYQGDFVSVSFVGAYALAEQLNNLHGVYVSSVMPSPINNSLAIVKEYQQAMLAAKFKRFSHESLEGYINAKVFTEILKQCGKNLSKQCFIQRAEHFQQNIGDLNIHYRPGDHQGMQKIYLQHLATDLAIMK